MKNIKIYLGTVFLVLAIGCTESFLEEVHPTKFTSQVFFTNDGEAQSAAIGMYEYMSKGYGMSGDGFLSRFDMATGDDFMTPKNGGIQLVPFLTLNYNSETPLIKDAWQYSYQTIYRTNWIISNVTDNANISETVKNQVLSEAYFMRGYCYFNLTRLFQEVPIVLTPQADYYPAKATNEECWAQVFADFEKSLELGGLPEPEANFMDARINKGVVYSLMARAYLYRTRPGNTNYWDKVKEYADKVEKLNKYTLEPIEKFRSMFVYTKNDTWVRNSEVIWGAGFIYGPIYGGTPFLYDPRNNLSFVCMPLGFNTIKVKNDKGATYLFGNGIKGVGYFAASPGLSDIMINYHNKGDKRTGEFLCYPKFNSYALLNSQDKTSVYTKEIINSDSLYNRIVSTNGAEGEYLHFRKFEIQEFIGTNIWDGGYNHSLIYPVIRFADVLLMRAEAEFQLGSEAVAKSYLKKVTDRAGFASNYLDQFSGQSLIDEILNQRRVELVFESTRVPDLIRLDKFKPPYVGTYPGSFTWEEKYKVLPIPQRELDLNTNLVQNDLWR